MLLSALISICSFFSWKGQKKSFYFWRFRRLATISFFKTSVKGARSLFRMKWWRARWGLESRADKGWAVKRARPSKKVWYRGLGLCLKMSLVFDFGQCSRCGLYIRHCRCHWIMAPWFVFLHFFLVPLCWYAVSERQMLLFFARGLGGVDKHLFQRVSFITSMTLPLNYIFVLLLANVDVIPKQKQLSTV